MGPPVIGDIEDQNPMQIDIPQAQSTKLKTPLKKDEGANLLFGCDSNSDCSDDDAEYFGIHRNEHGKLMESACESTMTTQESQRRTILAEDSDE